ncbi:MAG TPA: hypothetical protein VEC36_06690 [Patescibacteria group bacterium]|nr:hypothetical protein [Patescibacteria group bacterium]
MGNTLETTKESLVRSPNGQDRNCITAVAVENYERDKTIIIEKDNIKYHKFGNTGPGIKVILSFKSEHGDIWQEEYRFEYGETFKKTHEVDTANDVGTSVIWCDEDAETPGMK